MRIYLNNNPTKFNFIPIGFETTEPWALEKLRPDKTNFSSDMGSVPNPKILQVWCA